MGAGRLEPPHSSPLSGFVLSPPAANFAMPPASGSFRFTGGSGVSFSIATAWTSSSLSYRSLAGDRGLSWPWPVAYLGVVPLPFTGGWNTRLGTV